MSDLVLHDYQKVAVDYIQQRERAALFMDMGLGKTAVALSALEPAHLPALVVAPKKVAETVWHVERDLWRPDLSVAVAKGEPHQRKKALASDADIVVIGRDNLRDVFDVDRATPFRTFIIDELSGYKNRASQRWKAANKISKTTPYVWGLTGTPSPNGYLDLWAQVALLDGGERLGKNITTYRSRYFIPGRQLPNGTIIEWLLREEAEANIKAKIEDICLAMETDGRVKLPEVTENRLLVELPNKVKKVYREFRDTLVIDLEEIFGGEIHTAKDAATLTSRLAQITAGFIFVDDADIRQGAYTRLHTAKVEAVREIVESDHIGGVLVFYRFIPEKEMLLEGLQDLGVHTMDEPDVVDRWNAGEIPVLLAHPASAGHGLNLQHGGHIQVWTTLPWDLEQWEQGIKRLYRQGQKHPVIIHVLTVKGTVDVLDRARLAGKADVQNDLLAYLESPL